MRKLFGTLIVLLCLHMSYLGLKSVKLLTSILFGTLCFYSFAKQNWDLCVEYQMRKLLGTLIVLLCLHMSYLGLKSVKLLTLILFGTLCYYSFAKQNWDLCVEYQMRRLFGTIIVLLFLFKQNWDLCVKYQMRRLFGTDCVTIHMNDLFGIILRSFWLEHWLNVTSCKTSDSLSVLVFSVKYRILDLLETRCFCTLAIFLRLLMGNKTLNFIIESFRLIAFRTTRKHIGKTYLITVWKLFLL